MGWIVGSAHNCADGGSGADLPSEGQTLLPPTSGERGAALPRGCCEDGTRLGTRPRLWFPCGMLLFLPTEGEEPGWGRADGGGPFRRACLGMTSGRRWGAPGSTRWVDQHVLSPPPPVTASEKAVRALNTQGPRERLTRDSRALSGDGKQMWVKGRAGVECDLHRQDPGKVVQWWGAGHRSAGGISALESRGWAAPLLVAKASAGDLDPGRDAGHRWVWAREAGLTRDRPWEPAAPWTHELLRWVFEPPALVRSWEDLTERDGHWWVLPSSQGDSQDPAHPSSPS